MSEIVVVAAIGPMLAAALFACYRLAVAFERSRALRAADRIARAFRGEAVLRTPAGRALKDKVEAYRVAQIRGALGTSSDVYGAARALVQEYRLVMLDFR